MIQHKCLVTLQSSDGSVVCPHRHMAYSGYGRLETRAETCPLEYRFGVRIANLLRALSSQETSNETRGLVKSLLTLTCCSTVLTIKEP